MASIPLPALHVNPPQQGPSPFEQLAQLQQLRNQPLQTQALQQSVQGGQLENQIRQQQLMDQKAMTSAMQQWDGKDVNDLPGLVLKQGGSAQAVFGLKNQIVEQRKNLAAASTAELENQGKMNDMIVGHIEAIKAAPPDQQQALYDQARQSLGPRGAQLPPQYPGDAALTNFEKQFQGGQQLFNDEMKRRETAAAETQANARMTTATTEQQKVQASMNPQSSLYAPSPAAVAMGTAPGAAQIKANEVQQAARKASAEEYARMPGEMTLNAQRQALAQGDPKMAGHLMVTGDATLGELKSRGATPQFIAQALQAAHDESGGKYNAQAAEAQFDVAKSPANNNFFGSAKSLTDKGGTLDQLADAAKAIPGGKIPAFNSIADWEKAATGSGPIAKYATLALSVADDWSKVMGSGSGSDASRAQALQRVGANLSPEQRAASIEGLRGGVNSQITSRIGKNPVLQRMYGDMVQSAGGGLSVQAPNGKTYTFKSQADADAFKQRAGIQ